VIVDEGEEIGLVAADDRPVQSVAGPQVVALLRLEAAEGPRGLTAPPGQAGPGEMALDGAR